ncbi:MAG TPA: hypothetical protein VFK68_04980 [Propionibacteriaceae bacterium]|nr:hypothetical protein [Propionibacteriaceae bacterium]
MTTQRVARVMGSLVLVMLGVQGVLSPLARLALARTLPHCVESGPVSASLGTSLGIFAVAPDCPHGSYAPASSYHLVAQVALTASVTALVLGVLALLAAFGVALHVRRALADLRHWFARRFRLVVAAATGIVVDLRRPAMVPVPVRSIRSAGRPHVRRGPPSCSL